MSQDARCPSCNAIDPSEHGPTEFCAICKPMPPELGDDLVTVLVIRHQDGVSTEGAIFQRNEADKALARAGLDVVAATTGRGDAMAEGLRIIRLTWGIGDV